MLARRRHCRLANGAWPTPAQSHRDVGARACSSGPLIGGGGRPARTKRAHRRSLVKIQCAFWAAGGRAGPPHARWMRARASSRSRPASLKGCAPKQILGPIYLGGGPRARARTRTSHPSLTKTASPRRRRCRPLMRQDKLIH